MEIERQTSDWNGIRGHFFWLIDGPLFYWYGMNSCSVYSKMAPFPISVVQTDSCGKDSNIALSPYFVMGAYEYIILYFVDYQTLQFYLFALFKSFTNSADCWWRISEFRDNFSKALTSSETWFFNFFSRRKESVNSFITSGRSCDW